MRTHIHTRAHAYRNTHSWQALRPLRISSGEDLHSAPGRSTDKLPRQRRETESLAAGRDSAQKTPHPSDALQGARVLPPASTGPRLTVGPGWARTIFWKAGGPGGQGWTFPPWGHRKGSEASVPLELALGPQPRGYHSQIRPRFPPIKDAD